MKFPLVGSAVLFSLFLAFKFLPKHIVNLILSGAAMPPLAPPAARAACPAAAVLLPLVPSPGCC